MATFLELKNRVKDYLIDVPTKTDTLVGAWINQAIRDAEEMHDYKHMEANVEMLTQAAAGLPTLDTAKPSTWKKPREAPYFRRDDGSTREIAWSVNEQDMRRLFAVHDSDDDGEPQFVYLGKAEAEIFEVGADFLVHPWPDGDSDWADGEYRINLPHWAYSAALVANADTNFWTNDHEWYVAFQAAAHGLFFNRDETATDMFSLAGIHLRKATTLDKRGQRRPPDTLIIRKTGPFGPGRRGPRKL